MGRFIFDKFEAVYAAYATGTTKNLFSGRKLYCLLLIVLELNYLYVATMRNAESKMRNRKCGVALIGRTVKPRDRCHSAYYRKSTMTSQIGRAVKCGMRKMQTMKQDCVVDRTHTL